MRVGKKEIVCGWAVSCSVGASIIFISLYLSDPMSTWLGTLTLDKLFIISVIVMISPPAVLHHMQSRWKRSVDRNLPSLLRDVANAQYTGMTFIRALEESAKKDYGPLSEDLRWALAKISWGIPYEEALLAMAKRTGTALVRRAVLLIIETGRTGGNIVEIMQSIARHIRSLEALERERFTNMKPNVYVVYLGFFVMIFTVVLIYTTLIVQMLAGGFAGGLATIRVQPSPISQLAYLRTFFHTSVIVALFGGLIAGQMGEGSVAAGLKHSLVLLIVTLVTFLFFIAG